MDVSLANSVCVYVTTSNTNTHAHTKRTDCSTGPLKWSVTKHNDYFSLHHVYIGWWQWRSFFVPYLCQLRHRSDVGQAPIAFLVSYWSFSALLASNCGNLNSFAFTQTTGIKFCRFPTSHSTPYLPHKVLIVSRPDIIDYCDVTAPYV